MEASKRGEEEEEEEKEEEEEEVDEEEGDLSEEDLASLRIIVEANGVRVLAAEKACRGPEEAAEILKDPIPLAPFSALIDAGLAAHYPEVFSNWYAQMVDNHDDDGDQACLILLHALMSVLPGLVCHIPFPDHGCETVKARLSMAAISSHPLADTYKLLDKADLWSAAMLATVTVDDVGVSFTKEREWSFLQATCEALVLDFLPFSCKSDDDAADALINEIGFAYTKLTDEAKEQWKQTLESMIGSLERPNRKSVRSEFTFGTAVVSAIHPDLLTRGQERLQSLLEKFAV